MARAALDGPSRPLPPDVAASAHTTHGFDFSRVRIHHDDPLSDAATAAFGARAFSYGEHIVFGRGRFAPETREGLLTLGHELVHVAQRPRALEPPRRVAESHSVEERAAAGLAPVAPSTQPADTLFLQRDPTKRATYPTSKERAEILEEVKPEQQEAAASGGGEPSPVTDPVGFCEAITPRVIASIDGRLPEAEKLRESTVSLASSDLDALAAVAEEAVEGEYGSYIHAGGTDLEALDLRSRMGFIPPPAETSAEHIAEVSNGLVERIMETKGADLLDQFNVTLPRDETVFNGCRDAIVTERREALKMLALFIRGFETPEHFSFIQRKVAPAYSLEPEERTRRRGRWETFATALHEMLHSVTHDEFFRAAAGLEKEELAVEGVTEYFTRHLYQRLSARASSDDALRRRIEGAEGSRILPPERTSGYDTYLPQVERIVAAVGNEESLRVAYFMGRVEFIGLGGWNETEAKKRYLQRFPAWELGAAIVIDSDASTRLVRARIGRVLAGRTGSLQLNVGAGLTYLSPGARVGLGGDLQIRYEGANLYVAGGLLVGGSTTGAAGAIRLDAIPRVEIGAKLGRVRAGVGVDVLMPMAGGEADDRTLKALVGLGVSVKVP